MLLIFIFEIYVADLLGCLVCRFEVMKRFTKIGAELEIRLQCKQLYSTTILSQSNIFI